MYQRKLAESPAKKVQVVSTCREDIIQSPVQEASILLPSMLELPCDSLHHNMQNLSPEGNSDDPIDNYHQELQVAQCHSTKPNVEICSEKKCKGTEISQANIIDDKEMIGSSPGVHKSGNIDLHVILGKAGDVSEREKLGDQTLKHCADVRLHFMFNISHISVGLWVLFNIFLSVSKNVLREHKTVALSIS